MNLGIIDYGMGNLRSVEWALNHLGLTPKWLRRGDDWRDLDAVILPGVGAFPKGMEELHNRGLYQPIKGWLAAQKPFLGICLGFQMLFESSSEGGGAKGFGVWPGAVTRLPDKAGLKVPQIGWNDVKASGPDLAAFDGKYFYFVHSFAGPETLPAANLTSNYGRPFVSAAASGKIWGSQFHPERSGSDGLKFLRAFLDKASAP